MATPQPVVGGRYQMFTTEQLLDEFQTAAAWCGRLDEDGPGPDAQRQWSRFRLARDEIKRRLDGEGRR